MRDAANEDELCTQTQTMQPALEEDNVAARSAEISIADMH